MFDEDNENQPALVRFVPTENENDEIIFDDINVVIEENVQDYHFAINGRSWAVLRWHFPHLVPKIIQRGMKIFTQKCTKIRKKVQFREAELFASKPKINMFFQMEQPQTWLF